MAVLVLSQQNRQAAHAVARRNDAAFGENEDGGRSLNHALGIADAVFKGVLAVDESGDQLGGVDAPAGHGVKVGAALQQRFCKLLEVVDDADGADGINAQVRMDEHGLRVGVADAADAGIALHLGNVAFKFCPKGAVFNVVNISLKAKVGRDAGHAAPADAQVRMVVGPEKDV